MRLEDKGSTIETTVGFDKCPLGSKKIDGVADTQGLLRTMRATAMAKDDIVCPATVTIFRPAA